jgi:hypothetical protein
MAQPAVCCLATTHTIKEFTFLLIRVLHSLQPAALEGSTRYARETVDRVFRKYTPIDNSYIEPHNYKFRNLIAESRLEIVLQADQRDIKSLTAKFISPNIQKGSQ